MASALDDVQSLLAPVGPATADEEMIIGDDPAPQPEAPKRGRGRPRKVPGESAPTPQGPRPKVNLEVPMPKPGVLADGVAQVYVFAGMGIGTVRPQTGFALASNAEDCGKAWEALAATNPAVRKALMSLLQTSVWGALIGAHIPVLMVMVQEGKQIAQAKQEAKDEAVQPVQAESSFFGVPSQPGKPGRSTS